MTSTRAPAWAASWTANVETPLPAPSTSTVSPRPQAAAREEGPVRRQPGERQRSGLLPREPCGLREDVRLGHGDELGERPVARAAEDLEVGPGRLLTIAPGERRVDHDLLAACRGARPAPSEPGVSGKRERVGAAADEQVAAIQRRRTELDEHLARGRHRIRNRLVAELAALVDADCLHQRSDAQGSSAAMSSTP